MQEMQETWVRSLGWDYPWRRAWQPIPVYSLRESHGQRSLLGTVHRVEKSQTWVKGWSMHILGQGDLTRLLVCDWNASFLPTFKFPTYWKYYRFKESWAPKNWCFWTVVLQKTLESPLDCKEIQPVHPKGDQSWVFIGRTDVEAETPMLWPHDAKNWLI